MTSNLKPDPAHHVKSSETHQVQHRCIPGTGQRPPGNVFIWTLPGQLSGWCYCWPWTHTQSIQRWQSCPISPLKRPFRHWGRCFVGLACPSRSSLITAHHSYQKRWRTSYKATASNTSSPVHTTRPAMDWQREWCKRWNMLWRHPKVRLPWRNALTPFFSSITIPPMQLLEPHQLIFWWRDSSGHVLTCCALSQLKHPSMENSKNRSISEQSGGADTWTSYCRERWHDTPTGWCCGSHDPWWTDTLPE